VQYNVPFTNLDCVNPSSDSFEIGDTLCTVKTGYQLKLSI